MFDYYRGGDGGGLAPLRRNNRATAKAPEISDEMAFPSLSSAAADTEYVPNPF